MELPRIKELRKARGLTQLEVANAIGVGRPTYCNWELGEYEIDIASLIKLAKFHGVTTDYILGLAEDKYASQVSKIFNRLSPEDQELVLKVSGRLPKKK